MRATLGRHRFRERQFSTGGRTIRWSVCPQRRTRLGRLLDSSASGAAFDVWAGEAPRTGAVIGVQDGEGQTPRHARVVRVARRRPGRAVVGCRWVYSPGRRKSHRPHRADRRPAKVAAHHQTGENE